MLDLERRGGRTAYTGGGRPGQHADCGRRGPPASFQRLSLPLRGRPQELAMFDQLWV